jgi:omega-hydroxypalmitate O-feruloyl transferase
MIARLKLRIMKENENIKFTTFESLAGYVWRSRARALKLSNNEKTMLNMLVGIRRNMKGYDPLPEGYYGNSIVDGKLVLKVSELNERPLYEIVKLIKETIKVVSNTDYVTNSIKTWETVNQEEDISMELEASGSNRVEAFRFHGKSRFWKE